MVRILIFLLCLLSRSNAFAYCYATQWSSYGPVYASLGVADGTTMQACQQLACQLYPHIPECGYTVQQPVCSNQVEYQTLACPVHSSGAINQSRTYNCNTSNPGWGPWTTTSNNCSPDPATCVASTETQTITCQTGYHGLITQSRTSICSDPYGTPTWTSWSTTSDTCTMNMTNVNNPTSPISPISPVNPNSVISQQITPTAPTPAIAEPVTVQEVTATVTSPVTTETPTVTSGTTPKSESQSGSQPVTSTTKTEAKIDVVTPKGKEIVPGVGIVMSMQLLNAGINMQQQQMQEYINLTQEIDDVRQQNILLEFIAPDDIRDSLNRIAGYRWQRLLGDNQIQSSGFGN